MYQMDNIVPLQDAPCGSRFRVSSLSGGSHRLSKLYAMGLLPGTEILVCHANDGGVRIRVRGASIVIGRCLAGAVLGCVSTEKQTPVQGCRSSWDGQSTTEVAVG